MFSKCSNFQKTIYRLNTHAFIRNIAKRPAKRSFYEGTSAIPIYLFLTRSFAQPLSPFFLSLSAFSFFMSRESWPRKCLEAKRGSGRSAQKAARRRWNITKTSFVTAASFIRIVVPPRTYKTTFHPHSQRFTSGSLSTLPLRYSEDRTLIGQLGLKGRKLYSFSCTEHGNTALVSGRQEASASELSHVTYFLFPRVVLCTRTARGYMYTLGNKYLGIYEKSNKSRKWLQDY